MWCEARCIINRSWQSLPCSRCFHNIDRGGVIMVGKLTPNTELSCSRLPAVMGYSPWATANDELAITVDAMLGIEREWNGNETIDWGNTLEPVILNAAASRLGLELEIPTLPFPAPKGVALNASVDGIVRPTGEVFTLVTDPARGIYVIGADQVTIDGPGVLESKLTGSPPEDEPAAYRGPLQIQGCMLCTGCSWGAVAVLYRGIELRIFVYPRNENLIAEILQTVNDFEFRKHGPEWYPPVNRADAVKIWGRGQDELLVLPLPDGAGKVIADLLKAKERIAEDEAIVEANSTVIMEMMGNHTQANLTMPDGSACRVKWPMRRYKAQPEKVTPAKPAHEIRLKSLDIKVMI